MEKDDLTVFIVASLFALLYDLFVRFMRRFMRLAANQSQFICSILFYSMYF